MSREPAPTLVDRARRALPLVVASAVAGALLAGAAALRLESAGAGAPLPNLLLALLVGTAVLLGAILAIPRAPRLAWALLTIAAAIGVLEAVAVVRSYEDVATGAAWRDLTLLAALALVGGVSVAGGYADVNRWDPSRLGRALVLLVLLGVLASAATAIWAFLLAAREVPVPLADGELTPLRFATRVALITIAGGFAVGLGRDLAPAVSRALARVEADGAKAEDDRLWRFLSHLADELLPSREAGRRRLAEGERARLAADLHALVLPDLRRAAAAAESAGAPEHVQMDLRRALEDVEQLMHERQSIVLEQFGLVAALEWLAERTEERSPLRVELDLGASVPDGPAGIAPDVARAAFRIALLGLDNVVRHANATTARLYLSLDRQALALVLQDDGAPPPVDGLGRAATSAPGRGHADMRAEASASGGELQIGSGTGARIEARWPIERVTRNHGTRPATIPDRREPSGA